jgi:hypothetical protein
VDLKKKRVDYASVMHFEGCFSFCALQFTVDEVQSVLLELDGSKGASPDSIPPIILKNCASTFARPLSLLFNRSLSTCVFPDRWKLSYVKPIFKKGRRNNVEDFRGVAIFSTILKRIELLVYRTINDDLKNLIPGIDMAL